MQQWLDVILAAGDLLTFAAALTNLTAAITLRRAPSCERSRPMQATEEDGLSMSN